MLEPFFQREIRDYHPGAGIGEFAHVFSDGQPMGDLAEDIFRRLRGRVSDPVSGGIENGLMIRQCSGAVSGPTASATWATTGAVRPRGSVSRAMAKGRAPVGRGTQGRGTRSGTASIDYGRSQDFIVHRIAAAKNVPGLENLTGLEALPPRGATLIALPMKIEGGSGGPVRVVGLIPKR